MGRRSFILLFTVILVGTYFLLVSLFVTLLSSKNGKKTETDFDNLAWIRHEKLDPYGRIHMKWNFTNEDIIIMVIAATTGYVGLGFSLTPSMKDADMIVGWIENNVVYLHDFYSTGQSNLILDTQQDVELMFGEQNGTHTIFCFKRKLNTCDKHDYIINNSTVYVLWSFHDEDPQSAANLLKQYHGRHRGSSVLHLLDAVYPFVNLENVEYIDIGANKTTKYMDNTFYYWCNYVKIPNFGEKHHMIGYIPLIEPEHIDLIHHILLYECAGEQMDKIFKTEEKGHQCYNWFSSKKDLACRRLIVSWSVGSKGEFLPPHIGYPFGSTDEKPHYLMVEVHYDYHIFKKDFVDSSKVRLYHTKHLRPNDASSFTFDIDFFEVIPLNQRNYATFGICSPHCTKNFPPTGIRIFRLLFHGHKAVRKMRLHHFRDGKEITMIADDNYNFQHQQARFPFNELVIMPNDWLAIECVHDSRNRTVNIVTGLDSEEEMCMAIIQYYPPVELSGCSSALNPVDVSTVTGLYYISEKKIQEIYKNSVTNSVYRMARNLEGKYETLTEEQANLLRRLYLNGNQVTFCRNDTGVFDTNEMMSYSQGTLLKDDRC